MKSLLFIEYKGQLVNLTDKQGNCKWHVQLLPDI